MMFCIFVVWIIFEDLEFQQVDNNQKDLMESRSGSKRWWCKMQKKTGAMAKDSIQSKDVSYIFCFLVVQGYSSWGLNHPSKNISQVGSLKPPPRSDICIVYLSQKEVTSIDQPLHLNPCNCAPGLSVEISHQTGSLSSFLSDEIRTSHFTQPFLRLWGCCWPTGHS